jgi:MFS family permease
MTLRRRWLLGIALDGTAPILTALAPDLEVAMLTFALTGLGNILLVGPEMRLFQELVSERFLGRVYSLRDVLNNIAFVAAFLIAGVLLTILGSRDIFVIAGALTLCFAVVAVKYFHPAEQAQVRAEEDFNTTLLIAPLDFRRRDPRYQPRHHHW